MFGFQDLDLWLMIPDIGVRTVGKPYPRIHLDSEIAYCVWMRIRGFGFPGLDVWILVSGFLIPSFGFMGLDSWLWGSNGGKTLSMNPPGFGDSLLCLDVDS